MWCLTISRLNIQSSKGLDRGLSQSLQQVLDLGCELPETSRPHLCIVSLEVDQAALLEPDGSQELALSTGLPGQILGGLTNL